MTASPSWSPEVRGSTTDGAHELEVARRAVVAAGELLQDHFRRGVRADWKGDRDPVTEADLAAEALIREHLAVAFGDDVVVGEEGADVAEERVRGRRRWYVDPLDGTANFLKRRPRWASSIGFCDADDRLTAAAVATPTTGEVFTATRGGGAWCNDLPVRAADTTDPVEAMTAVGVLDVDLPLDDPVALICVCRGTLSLRVTGSTVSDLCDVAAGRLDGFWSAGAKRWDLAAGILLCREAGATVTESDGSAIADPGSSVLAAAPSVHPALLRLRTGG